MSICNCIVHVIIVNCLYSCFLLCFHALSTQFLCLEHPVSMPWAPIRVDMCALQIFIVAAAAAFCVFWREHCQHAMHAVPLWCLTCIHAIVSRSPWVHGLVAPDKRHCQQWTSSLFCGFLPNPFIHDLFLWHTSQEFVKTDLYPLSLIPLRYAVCLTGCWSIIGRCVGACQWSNCAEERQP